jgi:hypothetical protein
MFVHDLRQLPSIAPRLVASIFSEAETLGHLVQRQQEQRAEEEAGHESFHCWSSLTNR